MPSWFIPELIWFIALSVFWARPIIDDAAPAGLGRVGGGFDLVGGCIGADFDIGAEDDLGAEDSEIQELSTGGGAEVATVDTLMSPMTLRPSLRELYIRIMSYHPFFLEAFSWGHHLMRRVVRDACRYRTSR